MKGKLAFPAPIELAPGFLASLRTSTGPILPMTSICTNLVCEKPVIGRMSDDGWKHEGGPI